jgi:hypothetical protein
VTRSQTAQRCRTCALQATAVLLVGVTALAGCGGYVTEPETASHPQIVLQVPGGALQDVATVTLTVTGPGMNAITRNMNVQGRQATLTLSVPAGEDRTFTVSAKDAQGTVLATGANTVDLEAGSSPTITIPLDITTLVELAYDDGDPSGGYYWPGSGYAFGVHMTSPQYPAKILTLSYYIRSLQAGGSGDGSFTACVFDFDGAPGSPLSAAITVSPAATGWVDVDVSGYNIQVQRDFLVAMVYDGTNTPSLGYDPVDNFRSWDGSFDDTSGLWFWITWGETYFIRATVAFSAGDPGRPPPEALD